MQVNGASEASPVLNLAGDRSLSRLAGEPGVEEQCVRHLDGLSHGMKVAFCYREYNLPSWLIAVRCDEDGGACPRSPQTVPAWNHCRRSAAWRGPREQPTETPQLVGARRRLAQLLAVGTRRDAGPLAERV